MVFVLGERSLSLVLDFILNYVYPWQEHAIQSFACGIYTR